jgi:hypothetical protein
MYFGVYGSNRSKTCNNSTKAWEQYYTVAPPWASHPWIQQSKSTKEIKANHLNNLN